MAEAGYFRDKARRCRDLLGVAIAPEVREQLALWEAEFDAQADMLERQATNSTDDISTAP